MGIFNSSVFNNAIFNTGGALAAVGDFIMFIRRRRR